MRSRLVPVSLVVLGLLSCSHQPLARDRGAVSASRRPNIVVLMLDDVGFGHLSSFGGPIPTPNIDRVAARGLRYTSFHTTALCSPSRAAFLTGRNHHSVGTGKVTELASDEPGYTGRIPRSAAMFPEVLRRNGYATMALGKWHNTPVEDVTPHGPYDLWPQSRGFEHFYGFLGGETDQWAPNVWDDKVPIDPASTDPDYLLDRDLGDRAVAFVAAHAGEARPFLLYLAPGTAHAPHHAPRDVIDRNRGKFDEGWDVLRARTFARQKELGLFPRDARMPPRPDVIPAWDRLSNDERRVFARMQEVFAGALEYADEQFGRVLDELERTRQLDDTIVMVTSDNGASGEGGELGEANHFLSVNGVHTTVEDLLRSLDALGSASTFNHYPAGWALAGNTPGQYWKQTTHEGGVRDPMILSWPRKIAAHGQIRTQFTHLVDVAPTLYELTGVRPPDELDGVAQMPLEGKSFAATLDDPGAAGPAHAQYFEMFGNRAIWSDGWKAVAFHGRWPWDMTKHDADFGRDRWELYHLALDPNESGDLASSEPARLKELVALFDQEAKAHHVYPLDDSTVALVRTNMERLVGGKTTFRYEGVTRATPETLSPPVKDRSHSILARVHVPAGGAEGVLATCGGRFGGYALYVKDGKLTYVHNFVGKEKYVVQSRRDVPEGDVELQLAFRRTGPNAGVARLYIDGEQVGEGEIPHTVPNIYSATESFDTGLDTATAAGDYRVPFAFTGRLDSVVVTLDE